MYLKDLPFSSLVAICRDRERTATALREVFPAGGDIYYMTPVKDAKSFTRVISKGKIFTDEGEVSVQAVGCRRVSEIAAELHELLDNKVEFAIMGGFDKRKAWKIKHGMLCGQRIAICAAVWA